MKKLLSILVCFTLLLSVALAVGCGGEGGGEIFNGKYKEATVSDLKAFSQEVEKVEDADDINFNNGLIMNYEMSAILIKDQKTVEIKTESQIKSTVKEGGVLLSSYTKASGESNVKDNATINKLIEELNALNLELYFADNNYYGKIGDGKYYFEVNLDSVTDLVEDSFGDAFEYAVTELDDVVDMIEQTTENKIYFDKSGEDTKIKVEASKSMGTNGEATTKFSMVLVYDNSYRLKAYQMEISGKGTVMNVKDSDVAVKIAFEPYTGAVELPKDLDTYEKTQSFNDFMQKLLKNSYLDELL